MTEFIQSYGTLLLQGTLDTLVMAVVSTFFAYAIGIGLGVLLYIARPQGLKPNKLVYTVLSWVVNTGRSIPFIILLVALIPLTRFLTGTSLGVTGAIVPLIFAAAPFASRLVEQNLLEVDPSLVEAAQSFGANLTQVVFKVLLPESLPSQIRSISITFITLFGYVAIAGTIGAGGLGDIAIRYGYQRYQDSVMVAAVVISIILVQIAQSLGDFLSRKADKRCQ